MTVLAIPMTLTFGDHMAFCIVVWWIFHALACAASGLLHSTGLYLVPLTISLGGIVTLVDNEIFRPVVVAAGEVALENSLGTSCIALLSIDRSTGHVRNHGIAAAPWVLCISKRVLLGSGLREPDITTIPVELTGLESFSDIFLDDDGTTSSVDEPCACRDRLVGLMQAQSFVAYPS